MTVGLAESGGSLQPGKSQKIQQLFAEDLETRISSKWL